jgi:hypothetical protein
MKALNGLKIWPENVNSNEENSNNNLAYGENVENIENSSAAAAVESQPPGVMAASAALSACSEES